MNIETIQVIARDSHARCISSLTLATATLICLTPAVGSGDIKRDKGKWKQTHLARNGHVGKRRPVTAAKLRYRSLTLHYTMANKCFKHVDTWPINSILAYINTRATFWFYIHFSFVNSYCQRKFYYFNE